MSYLKIKVSSLGFIRLTVGSEFYEKGDSDSKAVK
jgi:hypothetical protein